MRRRGVTLLELMIALALLAIVASLALPPFAGAAQRTRLKAAAETLAADLASARFEAAQRGLPVYLKFGAGPGWCWSVATSPGCACASQQACQIKSERGADHPGIELLKAGDARFDPAGPADGSIGAAFQTARGERLQVDLSALGRASICAPAAPVAGYPACSNRP